MVKVEIVGYRKIEKEGRTCYFVSAVSEETLPKTEGFTTYNGFLSSEHLEKNGVTESQLIGRKAKFYNIKKDDKYETCLTLKT